MDKKEVENSKLRSFPPSANSSWIPVLSWAPVALKPFLLEDPAKDQLHPTRACHQESWSSSSTTTTNLITQKNKIHFNIRKHLPESHIPEDIIEENGKVILKSTRIWWPDVVMWNESEKKCKTKDFSSGGGTLCLQVFGPVACKSSGKSPQPYQWLPSHLKVVSFRPVISRWVFWQHDMVTLPLVSVAPDFFSSHPWVFSLWHIILLPHIYHHRYSPQCSQCLARSRAC